MVLTRLKGVNKVRKKLASGTYRIHYYHRATGLKLYGKPGSPEFIESYWTAERAIAERQKGTFGELIRKFSLSPEFSKRADSTQKEYKRMLRKAEEHFATMPLSALNDGRVRQDFMEWRETVAKTSGFREADNRLSVISAMLSWGVDTGRLTANHISKFKRLHHADRSEIIWLPEHINAFMAIAPIEMQRALIIALHTGQRQGDILKLKWSNYDGTRIDLRQEKSRRNGLPGKPITIKCTQTLKTMLDGIERKSEFILCTKTGHPFKKRYFLEQWDKATSLANLNSIKLPNMPNPQKLHFHDLRGTAVTMLALAGNDVPAIATITGHSQRTASVILDKYLARTSALADSAIDKFEASEFNKFANQLQTVTPNN
jgi:integrase